MLLDGHDFKFGFVGRKGFLFCIITILESRNNLIMPRWLIHMCLQCRVVWYQGFFVSLNKSTK